MQISLLPLFRGQDNGDGGIRRVVEAQRKYLPDHGISFTPYPAEADVLVAHGGSLFKNTDPITQPLVSHCHGLYWSEYQWPNWALDLNAQVAEAVRQADVVTAPSEWVAQAIRRGSLHNPVILGHGIEPDDWLPGTNNNYVLWNKTRIDPVCDPWPAYKLAELLPGADVVTTFLPSASANQLPNLKVTGRLPFEEAKEWIRNAGVYLCTARETFGIGTLEAMACGVPILGFKWGGQAEFIEHKVNGYLVTPGNIDELAEGLQYCMAHRDELGAAAREKVLTSYTWPVVMERYVAVYEAAKRLADKRSQSPAVSVVVTNYNMERYLEQCVKSVQKQTYTDWELLLVDDGSTDNSLELANQLAASDSRIKVISNPTNQYLSEARNTAIQQAAGRYIFPLDVDDCITPTTLALLAESLDRDRSIHIAYGSAEFFDEPVGQVFDVMNDSTVKRYRSGWPGQFDFRAQITHRNQLPYSSMYRRQVWERTGGYRRRLRTAEDAEFWCRVTSYGFRPKKVTDAITLVYRNRADSMSHVEPEWDWTGWFPWSRHPSTIPFAAVGQPIKNALSWPVNSAEPAQIAVIIPCSYDHMQYVIDAVDSVDAQTYRKWEILIGNDTGLKEVEFRRLSRIPSYAKVISTKRRGSGISAARNVAINASSAPYILPLDADDYLQPDALGTLLAAYESAPSHPCVIYSDWFADKGNGVLERHECDDWSADLLKRRAVHAVTSLFRKADWELVAGYDLSAPGWEDWDFSYALAAQAICAYRVPEPLLVYRMHTGVRREESVTNKTATLEWIKDKYKETDITMACRSCPSGRVTAKATPPPVIQSGSGVSQLSSISTAPLSASTEPMTTIEYIGSSETFNVIGQSTGARYRFGKNTDRSIRYVYAADAARLLSMKNLFRTPKSAIEPAIQSPDSQATPDATVLVAQR